MRAPAWRTLRLAFACALAILLIPSAAPAQLPGVDVPDPPLELPGAPATAVDELVRTVEQETGVDVPGLGGQPDQQPPPASPDQPAAAPTASNPPEGRPPAATPADPEGGAVGQASAEGSGSSPPSAPQGRGGGERGGGEGPVGGGDGSPRGLPAASVAGREDEETSPVRRVFGAIGDLPWALMAVIGALALLGLAMVGRSTLLVRLARRLTNQGNELREDVGALQTALLPAIPAQIGSVELSVAYRAAEGPAAGGDFHDVLPLDGKRVAIVIGDVCGHGREALTITALVHYTVRAYLEAGMQPRQALRLADQALGGKLGGEFATVLAAVYDSESSTLVYSTAGHPVPVILGESDDHAVTEMTPPPIGLGPPTGFRETRVALRSGSRVCFFTDGLIEQRDGGGAMLGREGLVRSLTGLEDRTEAEAALDRLAGSAPAADDLTLCLARPLDAAGDGTVVEELELEAESDPKPIAEFLASCGLDAEESKRALAEIGACAGSALLRVDRGAQHSSFAVTEPAGGRSTSPALPSRLPAPLLAS